ncbi:transporter [Cognatitamlana onchidii]|uniref:transporter n=1 Tax=Cognatitamlana onchidii TaxID=2562860 RepID=UPI0010A64F3F|nr:transporter [Algibacter onchidii]
MKLNLAFWKLIFLLCFLFTNQLFFAQNKEITLNDSTVIGIVEKKSEKDKINDILLPYGWIDYNAEYYTVDAKNSYLDHHFIYQPYLSKDQVFQIELGLVNTFTDAQQYFSPSDLDITYQRNITPKNKKDVGYVGMIAIAKLTIPTGREEYFSGSDNWAFEPQVGAQWSVFNPDWLISGILRYRYHFATLPEKSLANNYVRVESFFGFENDKFWIFGSPDYRYTPKTSKSNLFFSALVGYKFSRQFIIKGSYKPRLEGNDFYRSMLSFGFTLFF